MNLLSISKILCFWGIMACLNHKTKGVSENAIEDDKQPLILTPLINSGKIKEAQEASEVKFKGFKGIKSYSGYFTVSEQFNSNIFFWFFPSETNYVNAPVVLWLQGGPGASSLIGLFVENGPFQIKNKHGLKLKPYYWSQTHSVIYIDNPVGSGYSFTNEGDYAQNETIVGEQLYTALLQFFQLFPELQKNNFFITGESYAGKYVPAVSYHIMKHNPSAKQKINLQGLAIGNGFCDPENQLGFAEYLNQLGLIDSDAKSKIQGMVDGIINHIHKQEWSEGFTAVKELILGDKNEKSFFNTITGFNSHYNYLYMNDTSTENLEKYVTRPDIREAIHVGNVPFSDGDKVKNALQADFLQSIAPLLTELLNNYRVLLYNGQLDIIVAYPLTINFVQKLKFKDSESYKTAKRNFWTIDGDIAGYVKHAGNFMEILVRDAGHMVPLDQPMWALDMITRFTQNKPFY